MTRIEVPAAEEAKRPATSMNWTNAAILFGWLCLVLAMVHYHVVWRDEVRALSFARYGDNVIEMLKGLRGDSNPALWHLLLRGAYSIFHDVRILQVVAATIGIASAILLIYRSPFSRPIVIAILAGEFFISEYVVVARNYGLSVLFMFLLAILYPRHRNKGIFLGAVLLLLQNANVHSVLLGGSFVLFWAIETVGEYGLRWSKPMQTLAINACLFGLGAILCVLTVYPTFNDAAVGGLRPDQSAMAQIVQAVLQPASRFEGLTLNTAWTAYVPGARSSVGRWLMSIVMFGSVLGLIRRPAAMVAAIIALLSLSLLFTIVYPGFYRHQALWLVFLIAMYWIVRTPTQLATVQPRLPDSPIVRHVSRFGYAMFAVLLVLQIPGGIRDFVDSVIHGQPLSRVRELATLVSSRPELRDAIIIADPDYLVEPIPYYLPNATYFVRERRFGRVARFTKTSKLDLSLDELLATGRCLVGNSKKPVIFLIKTKLDPSLAPATIKESYNWNFSTDATMVRKFLSATKKIAHFEPVSRLDVGENYDVYQLDGPQNPCPNMSSGFQAP